MTYTFARAIMVIELVSYALFSQFSDIPRGEEKIGTLDSFRLEPALNLIAFTGRNNMFSFQLMDGTPLRYKDVRARCALVPENQTLCSHERAWLISNMTFFAISIFAVLGGALCRVFGLPTETVAETASYTLFGLGGISILGTMFCYEFWRIKSTQAINNYNRAVMGVPSC
jgi:hypothetical protein